jgi:hypothetical protein
MKACVVDEEGMSDKEEKMLGAKVARRFLALWSLELAGPTYWYVYKVRRTNVEWVARRTKIPVGIITKSAVCNNLYLCYTFRRAVHTYCTFFYILTSEVY